MKQQLYKSLFILLLSSFILSSCKKNDPEPTYEAKAKLLAGEKGQSKSWKLTGLTLKENNGAAQDGYGEFDACQKDNVFKFFNNSTQDYEGNEGLSKCDANDPIQTEKGNWFFSNDALWVTIHTNLFISSDTGLFTPFISTFGNTPGKVIELTDTSFKIDLTYTDNTDSITIGLSFTKL